MDGITRAGHDGFVVIDGGSHYMHGGLPLIGFSTIVYGVVGMVTIVRRFWRRK